MKTNKFADLIRHGISLKSLMTLSESEVSKLHQLYEEKKCPKCGKGKCECKESKKKMETKEQTPPGVTKQKVSYDKYIINPGAEMAVGDMIAKNVGGKTELTAKSQSEGEMKEGEKNKKKNPWAICTASVGRKDKKKFESCVMDVKKSMKEEKLPFDKILENKILSLLEKHTKPTMKKGELMNLIGKKKMNLPIGKLGSFGIAEEEETKTKPKTKPTTKPSTKPKPHDPFKPKPSQQPNPKAKKETKEAVMNAPVKEPTTRPTTRPTEKPKPFDPLRPKPSQQPGPKAKKKLPSWLTFDSLGIKFKK